jgi:hypothetical protein
VRRKGRNFICNAISENELQGNTRGQARATASRADQSPWRMSDTSSLSRLLFFQAIRGSNEVDMSPVLSPNDMWRLRVVSDADGRAHD